MKTTIRWKLLGSYLVLVLVMGSAFYGFLRHTLENYLVASVTENLFNEAALAALTAGRISGHGDAPAMATEIGRRISARITFIAADGTVIGDSEVPAASLATLDNHLGRPEVQQALQSGKGSSTRYSATLRTDMLYVAMPFATADSTRMVIRLALPLTALEKLKVNLHTLLAVAFAFAAIISLAMSSIFSQMLYRPLRQVAALAEDIGAGNLSRRLAIHRSDEFGNLAQVMNAMAGRIQEQLHNLATERNRLDAILRGMGEGLMVTDAHGAVMLVNPAFCGLFDVREEVIGRPLIDITRHPTLHESFKLVLQNRAERHEEITLSLGEDKIILTHWVPLLEGEELRGIVAVFHDISDLKRLEKIRKDFVANVSHELRTPVTVIKGYAETLLGGLMVEDPDRAQRFVAIILNHSERLATLISDLLTLSEMESGEFSLQLHPTPLAATIRHAVSLVELKAGEKGIVLDITVPDDAPAVLADQGRLEQVFINLLDNAVKYTPDSGGRVSVAVMDGDGAVTVRVSDTGPGIPPQSLPRIFERFYRVDTARSRDQGGTGLGLAIVKHIVQLHGGTISVESTPGKGSSFILTLRKA